MSESTSAATTPKRPTSKRLSVEFSNPISVSLTSAESTKLKDDTTNLSPATPSPPSKVRRSSTSMGYLSTPIHRKTDQSMLLNPDTSNSNQNSYHKDMFTSPSAQQTHQRTRTLPPTTPKSRNHEVFLSPSPKLKSPKVNSINKDKDKPIREISNNLKTRLNYAFVKLQNGWVDKTLPELENELDATQHTAYINKFAKGNGSDFDIDEVRVIDEGDTTSAHLAFIKALSSPKSDSTGQRQLLPAANKEHRKQRSTEVEAIETLMSLSSSKKQSRPSFSPNSTSITTTQNDTDVETEADLSDHS